MYQSFTPEFRQDIVHYCKDNPDIPLKVVAEQYGVKHNTLQKWLSLAKKQEDRPSATKTGEEAQLKKRIRELEMENKVLKAAAAYFAKDALPK